MTQPPITPIAVFGNAAPFVQAIVLVLLTLTVAAVVVCARKLASGRIEGGSAFLSGLRLGGPIAGCLGAGWGAFAMSIGLATVAGPVPMHVLARGFAEMAMLVVLGLFAGVVAVVANWAVEARIDRAVLKA